MLSFFFVLSFCGAARVHLVMGQAPTRSETAECKVFWVRQILHHECCLKLMMHASHSYEPSFTPDHRHQVYSHACHCARIATRAYQLDPNEDLHVWCIRNLRMLQLSAFVPIPKWSMVARAWWASSLVDLGGSGIKKTFFHYPPVDHSAHCNGNCHSLSAHHQCTVVVLEIRKSDRQVALLMNKLTTVDSISYVLFCLKK